MTSDKVRFKGVPIDAGGTVYIVPGLSTGQCEDLEADIAQLGEGTISQQLSRTTKIVHAALSRNYPDLTLGEFKQIADTQSIKEMFLAVFGQSAIERVGEAPAPQSSADQSTGNGSTQS